MTTEYRTMATITVVSSLLSGEHMTLRLRYLALKLRALCWVLRRLRAGQRGWHARPVSGCLQLTRNKLQASIDMQAHKEYITC
jgi:hypothetical protein